MGITRVKGVASKGVRLGNWLTEISPSGRGIKIWGKGKLPSSGVAFPVGDGRVEIYDRSRYFTVTGNHWAGQMLGVEEHEADLDWLLSLSPHGHTKVPFIAGGKIPKGSQHDTLVSIAGTMRARGCEYPEIVAALTEMNRNRLEEPAPEGNIRRIAESVCKYDPGDKRGIAAAERGLQRRADQVSVGQEFRFPVPVDEAAYYGLAGDIVWELEPATEADPVALLLHILIGIGNLVGRSPHFCVGGTTHHTNENVICVGKTSSARKGTAKADTFKLLTPVDRAWAEDRVMGGLSTGEGLIWAVRDETEKQEPIRDKSKAITGYQTVIVDQGVADKRLLVIEPEFASVLRVAGRDGNTLCTVYRQAWDSGTVRVLNKNTPVRATHAHISIIGHITRDELLMELSNNDKVNGFGNRNLSNFAGLLLLAPALPGTKNQWWSSVVLKDAYQKSRRFGLTARRPGLTQKPDLPRGLLPSHGKPLRSAQSDYRGRKQSRAHCLPWSPAGRSTTRRYFRSRNAASRIGNEKSFAHKREKWVFK